MMRGAAEKSGRLILNLDDLERIKTFFPKCSNLKLVSLPLSIQQPSMMQSNWFTLVEFFVEFQHFVWAMNFVLHTFPQLPPIDFLPWILGAAVLVPVHLVLV